MCSLSEVYGRETERGGERRRERGEEERERRRYLSKVPMAIKEPNGNNDKKTAL
jgi:hypothetical protein